MLNVLDSIYKPCGSSVTVQPLLQSGLWATGTPPEAQVGHSGVHACALGREGGRRLMLHSCWGYMAVSTLPSLCPVPLLIGRPDFQSLVQCLMNFLHLHKSLVLSMDWISKLFQAYTFFLLKGFFGI